MPKFKLLSAIAALTTAFFSYAATPGTVYVIPINADGGIVSIGDGDYQGQIALSPAEGETGVSAKNIKLENGFIFYTSSTDGKLATFYKLLDGEEASLDSPNRLIIAQDASSYIKVPAGTYDITFVKRSGSEGYNTFTIKESKIIAGVENVAASDEEVPAEYYDLSGHHINGKPTQPGVYIIKEGATVYKVRL